MKHEEATNSISPIRVEMLNAELNFVQGVSNRLTSVDTVVDPATGSELRGVRVEQFKFGPHCGTDTQLALRLLIREHTASDVQRIIQQFPVNRSVAFSVLVPRRRFGRGMDWKDAGILLAASCWSPIDELTTSDNAAERTGSIQDVMRVVSRMSFPEDVGVWLALASTTGWAASVPQAIDGRVRILYFESSSGGNWSPLWGSAPRDPGYSWFEQVVQPTSFDQLVERLWLWFETNGRAIASDPQKLTISIEEVAKMADVPERLVPEFFETLITKEPGRWSFERDRARLLSL